MANTYTLCDNQPRTVMVAGVEVTRGDYWARHPTGVHEFWQVLDFSTVAPQAQSRESLNWSVPQNPLSFGFNPNLSPADQLNPASPHFNQGLANELEAHVQASKGNAIKL